MKENQQLHKGSLEIEDDIATLADKNIFPGDILWVKDSGFYENRDIAGNFFYKFDHNEIDQISGISINVCNSSVYL